MELSYLLAPFVAWFVAGCTKFAVNSLRARRLAFDLIGYGGLPSTHSAVASAPVFLVVLREGINHPAVAIGAGLVFVVLLDATSLRRQVGRQAEIINRLTAGSADFPKIRERMGHSKIEVLAGIFTGFLVALALAAYSAP